MAEIAGHDSRIGTVCVQGEKMVKEGHFAADDITRKIKELRDKWEVLKVVCPNVMLNYLFIKSFHNNLKIMLVIFLLCFMRLIELIFSEQVFQEKGGLG